MYKNTLTEQINLVILDLKQLQFQLSNNPALTWQQQHQLEAAIENLTEIDETLATDTE